MYGVCAANVKYSREMEDIFFKPWSYFVIYCLNAFKVDPVPARAHAGKWNHNTWYRNKNLLWESDLIYVIQGHRHTAASPETFFGIPMREKEKNTCMYYMWHINMYMHACIMHVYIIGICKTLKISSLGCSQWSSLNDEIIRSVSSIYLFSNFVYWIIILKTNYLLVYIVY